MNPQNAGVVAAEERARISMLLRGYPDLTREELAEVHNWFSRVATPFDIGMIASEPDIEVQYKAYRAEQLDRFKPRDMVGVMLFVGTVASVVAMIALLKP